MNIAMNKIRSGGLIFIYGLFYIRIIHICIVRNPVQFITHLDMSHYSKITLEQDTGSNIPAVYLDDTKTTVSSLVPAGTMFVSYYTGYS